MTDIASPAPQAGLSSASQIEPEAVSPLRASIPDAWHFIADGEFYVDRDTLVYALGRYGDIYGPLPAEMFHPDVWTGDMLHGSHDVIAVARCERPWREVIATDAQAIEARRAETGTGSVHESAVAEPCAQGQSHD